MPTLASTFTYTRIPGTAQYENAPTTGKLRDESVALDGAKKSAEKDPATAYICQGSAATFYTGRNLWLGSMASKDTHLVAEVYDTTDVTTRDAITATVRDSLWSDGIDTRGGTTAKPREVKAGIVFCDFTDVDGGGAATIADLKQKLVGPAPTDTTKGASALEAFVRTESNGRVTLTAAHHPSWVRLKGKHSDYVSDGDFTDDAVLREIDAAIDVPDGWEIVIVAFAEKDVVTAGPTPADTPPDDSVAYAKSAVGRLRSNCAGSRTFDPEKTPAQQVQVVFISPSHYGDTLGAHIVTIHEVMHALGLPDIYDGDRNRSYGWSLMSDNRAGWHLTGYERLVLGWEDLTNWVVLKRGLLPVDGLAAAPSDTGKKGVLVLPDAVAGRTDVYVVERAQEIGVGVTNRDALTKTVSGDRGLLAMIVRLDKSEGWVVPFVAARASDVVGQRRLYGGAAKAAFTTGTTFDTSGVFALATPGYGTDDKRSISRVIGVDATWRPPASATSLRENERIVVGDDRFELTTSGALLIDGAPCFQADGSAAGISTYDRDYGFSLSVEAATGDLCLVAGVDATSGTLLRRLPRPTGAPAPAAGRYAFTVEKQQGAVVVAVYAEKDGKALGVRQYTALTGRQGTLSRHWSQASGSLKIALTPDGNLVVSDANGFRQGSVQAGLPTPSFIAFDATGAMTWLDANGGTLKAFAASSPGTAPFTLAAVPTDAAAPTGAGSLVVQDATKKTLATVFAYPK